MPINALGRTFVGYSSAYSAAQNQPRRVRRSQSHKLQADFNGDLLAGDLITDVRWDCTSPWALYMRDAEIAADRRSVSVWVDFNYAGLGGIKATVESESGARPNFQFLFTVLDAPLYPQANYASVTGPYVLETTAP